MELRTIDYGVDDDGLARIVLNRPEAGNGIDMALATELMDVANRCSVDRRVRAVLVAGNGRNFCVGGDLREFRAAGDGVGEHIRAVASRLHVATARLARIDAPVVCAVQGSAAGAGMSLAIACDLVIAEESAKFVLAYTRIGVSPDGGASWFLPRLIGTRRSLELALLNDPLGAAEAHALGLVTRVVADGTAGDEAAAVARALAAGPTRAYGSARRLLRDAATNTLETHLELEAAELAANAASADGREGLAAFLDKRAPSYRGE